jgi:hypothetical protein
VGVAHLSQDLGLAEHHRLDTRRDAAEMSHGVGANPSVSVRAERFHVEPAEPGEELEQLSRLLGEAVATVARRRAQFGTVTRGKEREFGDPRDIGEPPGGRISQQSSLIIQSERETLTERHRGGVMTDSDQNERHRKHATSLNESRIGATQRV